MSKFKVGDTVRWRHAYGGERGTITAIAPPFVQVDGLDYYLDALEKNAELVTPDPRAAVVKETFTSGSTCRVGVDSAGRWWTSAPNTLGMTADLSHPAVTAPGPVLPTDSTERKNLPLATGCLDYFPAALAAVAELSRIGNEKHNPGEPLHHARGKSMDHADCLVRHLIDRGTTYAEEVNGQQVTLRHSTALAWRALALLQRELEEQENAPTPRGAK